MPYSFIEIEKQKSWAIKAVFVFLLAFYFLAAELLWFVTRLFWFSPSALSLLSPGKYFSFSLMELAAVFIAALAIACLHWYYSTKEMLSGTVNMLGAASPNPKDTYHRVFKNVVDEVSVATGGKNISCFVVPCYGMNAFAVSDFEGNSVIGVTEGLLAKLNRNQLEAVVGHEAAHIASGDSFTTTVICSLFGIYGAILEGINTVTMRKSGDRDDTGVNVGARLGIYLVVIYLILLVVKGINYLLNIFISRQKEYRADAVAVRLTRNPLALSEALYIISRGWRGVGAIPDSLSPIFIMSPDHKTLEESEGFFSDLLSTHPPVKERLNILLDMAHADIASLKGGLTGRPKMPVEAGIEEQAGIPAQPIAEDQLIYKEVCPKCKQSLSEVLYEGAPVSKCAFCEGIFAAKDAVSRILAREVYSFSEGTVRDAEKYFKNVWTGAYPNYYNVADPLICPGCGRKMSRGFFSYGLPVEIDKCEDCRRIWFDKGELEMLQYLVEKSRSGELQAKRFYTALKNSINRV